MNIKTNTTKEQFDEYGYAYLENIISEQLCENFTKIMLEYKNNNKLIFENISNSDMYKNSYGTGNIPEMESFLKEITDELLSYFDLSCKISNSYTRIYYNGGTLKPHVDRPGLDYTLSITLFSNLKKEWPLYAIDKKGNQIKSNINRGDGLLILGTKMQHWRDQLICADDEYVVQLFLHWTNI
jgi:hypothetical protein